MQGSTLIRNVTQAMSTTVTFVRLSSRKSSFFFSTQRSVMKYAIRLSLFGCHGSRTPWIHAGHALSEIKFSSRWSHCSLWKSRTQAFCGPHFLEFHLNGYLASWYRSEILASSHYWGLLRGWATHTCSDTAGKFLAPPTQEITRECLLQQQHSISWWLTNPRPRVSTA